MCGDGGDQVGLGRSHIEYDLPVDPVEYRGQQTAQDIHGCRHGDHLNHTDGFFQGSNNIDEPALQRLLRVRF